MRGVKNILKILSIVVLLFNGSFAFSQTVSFELKTSPNITFDFNTIQEYINGITYMNALTLNINSDRRFDIYVGATTTNPGFWNVTSTYSNGGAPPPVSMLKIQMRNGSSTSLVSGFFALQDIATPTYIIGTSVAPDPSIACPNNGTNAPGDYSANPSCYKFNVDLRIVPGFSYQSGLYDLRVDYVIIQDL